MRYQDKWLLLEAEDDIDEVEHRPPTEEILFFQAVTNGNVEEVRKNCEQERFLDSDGVGVLSRNPVTNLKYHFVITTAMITRLCKQKGMELEQAFRMSDFYIQRLDDIHTLEGVRKLHDEMVLDYTEKMRRIYKSDSNSRHISACKDYIYSHLKERITIEDLADELGVSASYLSRLFKQMKGTTISEYILMKRMELAKVYLGTSNEKVKMIAQKTGYPSAQSFGRAFRNYTGASPREYQMRIGIEK